MVKRCLLAALVVLCSGSLGAAEFAFGLDGCPERVYGLAGETRTFEVFATLTTSGNDSPDGAQGWSISLGIEGGTRQGPSRRSPHSP